VDAAARRAAPQCRYHVTVGRCAVAVVLVFVLAPLIWVRAVDDSRWGLVAAVVAASLATLALGFLAGRVIISRTVRVALAAAAVPACVALTFEGGQFVLPGVAALLVVTLFDLIVSLTHHDERQPRPGL
jgi:hypothetical protein